MEVWGLVRGFVMWRYIGNNGKPNGKSIGKEMEWRLGLCIGMFPQGRGFRVELGLGFRWFPSLGLQTLSLSLLNGLCTRSSRVFGHIVRIVCTVDVSRRCFLFVPQREGVTHEPELIWRTQISSKPTFVD